MNDRSATVTVEGGKVLVSWEGDEGRTMGLRLPPDIAETIGFAMIEAAAHAEVGTQTIDVPLRSIAARVK